MTPEEFYDLPEHIRAILGKHNDDNPEKYNECNRTIAELKKHGYTADFGLDGELYDVQPIQ